MDNIPFDIFYEIIKFLDLHQLDELCKVNKYYADFCFSHWNKRNIAKFFLKKYKVDYNNPTNFIYLANKRKKGDFITKNEIDYIGLLELYKKFYMYEEIRWGSGKFLSLTSRGNTKIIPLKNGHYVSSFPIYPNLVYLSLVACRLTGTFPRQPQLQTLHLEFNLLESIETQPNLINLHVQTNRLKNFPLQPKLTDLIISRNQLSSFDIEQPELVNLSISSNPLTSFHFQPKLESIEVSRDQYKLIKDVYKNREIEIYLSTY